MINYNNTTKRAVYNGYQEKYMTGAEIYDFFKNSYERFGKHHSQISSYKIDFSKYYKNIKPNVNYRVFINDNFCVIFDNITDKVLYFFGYTNNKPNWAKD